MSKQTTGTNKYYDPSVPGSYSALSGFLKNNKNIKNVKTWAAKQNAITHHKPVRLKFERRKTIVGGIDHQWQCDLCDIQNLHAANDDYKFLLVSVDVFSKFAIVVPLKNKKATTVKRGFEKLILKRKPKAIQTDRGGEFFNRSLQKWFKQNHIKHFASHNYDVKAAVAERFLRTLKERMWRYFTRHNTRRYVECLPKLVTSYNNSFHRSIGMTPVKGSKIKNEKIILHRLYSRGSAKSQPKFKLNDIVRVAQHRGTFDKGYFPNWSEEYFRVFKIENTLPPVYVLNDMQNETLTGTFYGHELQKILINPNATYRIETIIERRGKQALVKFIGWPNKFNMWLDKKQISQLQK